MTAAEFLQANPAIATALSARDIETHIPAAIRQQSFFSARTVYAHHLSETQKDITAMLSGKMGPDEIRNRMQHRLEGLNYTPEKGQEGGLQDLSSDRRTNLIIDIQEQRARGYGVWRSQQKDSILTVWPANELYRAESRRKPRDWRKRWNDARADLGEAGTSATYAMTDDGPFVALKNDAIWTHPDVNRFGSPWPPFDYRSGMKLQQVKASKAREFGVLTDDAPGPRPARDPMRGIDSASVGDMSEDIVDEWLSAFGDRARIIDGRALICPDASVLSEILDIARTSTAQASAPFAFIPKPNLGIAFAPETTLNLSADTVRKITAAEVATVTDADFESLADAVRDGQWDSSNMRAKVMRFKSTSGLSMDFEVDREAARFNLASLKKEA